YKGLITLSYATKWEKWKFDVTGQFNGKARIPDTKKMPALVGQRREFSPAYFILLAQVAKKYKNVEVYVGGENLTDFRQTDFRQSEPITEGFAPYHTHFDTSMVWGPIKGRTIYFGLRWAVK
ncbi:MAG: TonB-dependent receptor, partial [Bacteroidetes bacterium]|nr:TonB-dependent receptor [Bacteroidota bacterium]